MNEPGRPKARGRGAQIDPANRFGQTQAVPDLEHVEHDAEYLAELASHKTEYFPDHSRTIIAENDSPDIPFRYSLNPYRGCIHGCAYCYARPTHEYLGLSAGLDFESKIFVKERAPELFREWLCRDGWEPETIVFSGVTDCYQPAERQYRLTRRCLEVALEARQPVGIITKNALMLRDLDLLREMAALRIVSAGISITTLDEELARTMEPRTSPPASRLKAVRELSAAGVPVRVMIAPVIPGLNDSEVPAILKAAKEAGAETAGYVLLRLPLTVQPVFQEWLERTQPTRRARVESLVRATRGGELYRSGFGSRMRGSGAIAEQIEQTFDVFTRKLGLAGPGSELDATQFRPPRAASGQLRLF